MVRKLKEIDIIEPAKKTKKLKVEDATPIIEEVVVEVQKNKNPPTEKQLAARERARVAREEKKNLELEEIKQKAIEEALKQKAIDDKKAAKAAERRAKKEKEVQEAKEVKDKVEPQTPTVAIVVPELRDEPKPDKPTFTAPKVLAVDIPPVSAKPTIASKPGIFASRPTDFDRGKKKGTPFGAASIVRRIM